MAFLASWAEMSLALNKITLEGSTILLFSKNLHK